MSNVDLEKALAEGPDLVAKALLDWRKATLDRERVEATLYGRFKAEDSERSATEIKYLIHNSQERYQAVLMEISCESVYNAKNETLLAAKKLASLRTAF